ncbi:MAG: pyrrolysine--tRNA(Pyl) ligase large subunit [Acidobacteria bacterium]|jgi:phenylalanyl-tRNA synthetase alpha chain|nr:pyrrolysine--tRNA(Pyl) ligase large subunit [Acidobacteriota bacterium]
MKIKWSEIQLRRLKELDADPDELNLDFNTTAERDQAFHLLEKKLIRHARFQLKEIREKKLRPSLCHLESMLVETLTNNRFVQVITPTIMSRAHLAKMSITEKHPLFSQVYWLDKDKCLRPMLAPHLYYVLKDLLRIWEKPVRIFEVGSCFRKESQGSRHSPEFTMLNLVEMGLPHEQCRARLSELADLVTHAVGLEKYIFETETSAVYGETIDVMMETNEGKLEVGSAAMGPHPLDEAWRITDAWVGIGFGLERLLMVKEKSTNLAKMGRSLSYLDGIRLNI